MPLGRIGGVFGIKGWVKVFSDTSPRERIFEYADWYLVEGTDSEPVEVLKWQRQGKGLIAHLARIDDRDLAQQLVGKTISVVQAAMPQLDDGDYYWHQLVGLVVFGFQGDRRVRLGTVASLIETGANDVLVVKADAESIDGSERLIPWVPEEWIETVDLDAGRLYVTWDADF